MAVSISISIKSPHVANHQASQIQAAAIVTMASKLQSIASILQDANRMQVTSTFSWQQGLAQMDLQMLVRANAIPESALAALSHVVPRG